jgi:hypothetical protein
LLLGVKVFAATQDLIQRDHTDGDWTLRAPEISNMRYDGLIPA